MKKVMVFGAFDELHEGHLNFFKQAKKHGDYLVVIVGKDKNIFKIKGKLPKNDERKRLNDIKKSNLVDKILLGALKNPYKRIKEIRPKVICLGYDQRSYSLKLKDRLKEFGLSNTKIVKLKAFKPKEFHSSIIN